MANITMCTRFFKMAMCRNFNPAEVLYELRLKEMPSREWDNLVEFYGSESYALEYIEENAAYDLYRWSNWTAAQDAMLSVSHLKFPEYYYTDLEDSYEELIKNLRASDAEMRGEIV